MIRKISVKLTLFSFISKIIITHKLSKQYLLNESLLLNDGQCSFSFAFDLFPFSLWMRVVCMCNASYPHALRSVPISNNSRWAIWAAKHVVIYSSKTRNHIFSVYVYIHNRNSTVLIHTALAVCHWWNAKYMFVEYVFFFLSFFFFRFWCLRNCVSLRFRCVRHTYSHQRLWLLFTKIRIGKSSSQANHISDIDVDTISCINPFFFLR